MVGPCVNTTESLVEVEGKTRESGEKSRVRGRVAGGVWPSLRLVYEIVSGQYRPCSMEGLTILFSCAWIDGSGSGSLSPANTLS